MRSCVMALAALALAVPALAEDDDAMFEVAGAFATPSGNIYCSYYDRGGEEGTAFHDEGSEIHCMLLKPRRTSVVLTGKGKLSVTHPSQANLEGSYAEKDDILAYGQTFKRGNHLCTSTQQGIRCKVKSSGFLLSKSGVKAVKPGNQ